MRIHLQTIDSHFINEEVSLKLPVFPRIGEHLVFSTTTTGGYTYIVRGIIHEDGKAPMLLLEFDE